MAVSGHSPTSSRCPGGRSLRPAGAPRPFALLALGATVLLLGCGSTGHGEPASSSLVAGERAGPIPPAQLAPAARLADRFAAAYARSAYLRRPPSLPGATPDVQRHLLEAAAHVPPARRSRHPRAASVHLEPRAPRVLGASVVIDDGSAPPFSIDFTVERRGPVWSVVAISSPG